LIKADPATRATSSTCGSTEAWPIEWGWRPGHPRYHPDVLPPSTLDLAVVGAGPAGLGLAIAAARAGLEYEVLEKGAVVNSIHRFPRGMTFFTTPERLELGNLPFVTPYAKPTREEALQYYRRVADTHRLALSLGERVESIEREGGCFALTTAVERPGGVPHRQTRRARSVVVATGTFDQPNVLGVPGEDLPHVSHYFDEPHGCYRRRVVVVGGSNSAVEAALALFRAGALVTLVHRRERLSGSIKYWVKPDIENRIVENAIAARFEAQLVRIGPKFVEVEGPQGREEIPADAVFLLTGYHPDTGLLARAGVRVDARTLEPEHDPLTLETNVPGLYVAGAMVAGADGNRVFIENGRFHGTSVVNAILGHDRGRA
jgi:thioredoxin reductase (NADPH)